MCDWTWIVVVAVGFKFDLQVVPRTFWSPRSWYFVLDTEILLVSIKACAFHTRHECPGIASLVT